MTVSLTLPDLETTLRDALGGALGGVEEDRGQFVARYQPAQRVEALQALKDAGFTHYVFCGGVDWPDDRRFEVLDHVYNIDARTRVTIRCNVGYDNPRLPSGVSVYGGADWYERETWEMFGIVFAGHPTLHRLLLPDWFEGFPMRKDYVLPARIEKPWPGDKFSG